MDGSAFLYRGETAALFAALFWAFASVLFGKAGKSIRPVELNLMKCVLALILGGITMLIQSSSFKGVDTRALLLLLASGVIGIGFGDTIYFKAIELLGARKALLVGALTPVVTALIALVTLHESLSLLSWLGMAITIAGIGWVITEQTGAENGKKALPLRGILYGLLFVVSNSIGAVFSRAALAQTDVSALQSMILRLAAGMVVILFWIILTRMPVGQWFNQEQRGKVLLQAGAATLMGTYLGIWLQQTAFKFSPAGITQTLSSTSPLFVLPIATLIGEKLSLRAIFGALLAMVGIAMLFLV